MNSDRKILIGLGVMGVMCLVTIIVVVASLFIGFDTNTNVNSGVQIVASQEQASAVSTCRARFSVDLVTAPQARAVKALIVYGYGSPESIKAAGEIQEDEYQALASLAETDVKEFLARCVGSDGKATKTCASFPEPVPSTDDRYDPALDGDGDGIACE